MSVFKGEAKLAFLGSQASGTVPSLGWCCGLSLLPGTAWLPSDWGGYSKARRSPESLGCLPKAEMLPKEMQEGTVAVP